ncbi:MAG: choice-of-anchor V domain-containing protein [Chitinophagales bacterium]
MYKQHFTFLLFSLAVLYIFTTASSNGRATAANADNTGAPSSTQTCGGCHSGGSYGTVTTTIEIFAQGTTTPVTTYTGGTTYDMKVTIGHTSGTPAGYGFELTCLTSPGNAPVAGASTYTNLASNVKQKLVITGTFNGRRYVEHNGVTSNNVFAFSWTAPIAGTGTVKFYADGNAVNGANADNGDKASPATSLTLPEAVPLSVTGTTTNVSCNGGNNGAINITAAGGSPAYTYNWGSGITTEDRTTLTAGTYTVTVTDNASATATATFTLTQPTALTVTGSATNVSCNGGSNGAVNITASGGTPAYTYNWGNNITTEDRTALTAGSYSVTVTDTKSCTVSSSFSVTQPNALVASNTPGSIACFGGSTTISVTASGGTAPYSGTGSYTVTAGDYSYTVTDANNCSATTSVNITQPTQLSAIATDITIPCNSGSGTVTVTATGGTQPYTGTGNFTVTTPGVQSYPVTDNNGCSSTATATVSSASGLSVTNVTTDILCNGVCNGAINTTVSGGTQPYSYNWSTNSSAQDIANLCAGTYTQTVSDNANCSIVNTYVVADMAALQLSILKDSVLCNGSSANVSVNVTGGASPYSYIWSSGGNTSGVSLTAGSYGLTVTDNNSCTATQSLTLAQPDSLQVTVANVTNDNGSGNGAIDISVSGGSSPYVFSWSNSATSEDISQLTSGIYGVTVTDANGCDKSIANISIVNTGVGEVEAYSVRVYPNPFTDVLQLLSEQKGILCIYNTEGLLVSKTELNSGLNRLDLSGLSPAIYMAVVNTNGLTSRIRLMKSR